MPPIATRPELAGTFGMVASTHWLASQTGMSVLERGGNAFDAAAAAGFVLQVAEPQQNGPGGDLPVVLWSEAEQQAHVVNGQGPAPAAATIEHLTGLGLGAIPGSGLLAAVVPGAFGAWTLLLQRWGTWPLRDVLDYAIGYARNGIPVSPLLSGTLSGHLALFTDEWTTSAAAYLDRGRAPAPWTTLRLPGLAATYERLVAEAEAAGPDRDAQYDAARKAWYSGFVAEAVDAFARSAWLDASGERHAGLLTGDDLAAWSPTVEAPVRASYRGVEFCKTGPWGQGPVLLQQLLLLEQVGLPDELDPEDASWVHSVLEVAKLAFADREAWYGDPDFVDVPLEDLLSATYAAERAKLVDPAAASVVQRPGSPGGRAPRMPRMLHNLPNAIGGAPALDEGPATPATPLRGDTVHLDVADRWGNLVSATPSGGWLQSSPVVPQLGFPLGTRAQMFWLQRGLASSLRPGARPRTTLSPGLAFRDGRPWLAYGTPGGDQQDQWGLMFALRMVHGAAGHEQAMQAAMDAPMAHSEHPISSFYPRGSRPGRVVLEARWPLATMDRLRRIGHRLEVVDGWSQGRLAAVARDGQWLRGASDPRGRQAYAVGR